MRASKCSRTILAYILPLVSAYTGLSIPPSNPPEIQYVAGFQNVSGVIGSIVVSSAPNGMGVNIQVSIANLPISGGPFAYYVASNPVASDGNCASAGGSLSVYGQVIASTVQPNRSALSIVGNISTKHGNMTGPNFVANYNVSSLSTLVGASTFVGNRSAVLEFANGTALACANFSNSAMPILNPNESLGSSTMYSPSSSPSEMSMSSSNTGSAITDGGSTMVPCKTSSGLSDSASNTSQTLTPTSLSTTLPPSSSSNTSSFFSTYVINSVVASIGASQSTHASAGMTSLEPDLPTNAATPSSTPGIVPNFTPGIVQNFTPGAVLNFTPGESVISTTTSESIPQSPAATQVEWDPSTGTILLNMTTAIGLTAAPTSIPTVTNNVFTTQTAEIIPSSLSQQTPTSISGPSQTSLSNSTSTDQAWPSTSALSGTSILSSTFIWFCVPDAAATWQNTMCFDVGCTNLTFPGFSPKVIDSTQIVLPGLPDIAILLPDSLATVSHLAAIAFTAFRPSQTASLATFVPSQTNLEILWTAVATSTVSSGGSLMTSVIKGVASGSLVSSSMWLATAVVSSPATTVISVSTGTLSAGMGLATATYTFEKSASTWTTIVTKQGFLESLTSRLFGEETSATATATATLQATTSTHHFGITSIGGVLPTVVSAGASRPTEAVVRCFTLPFVLALSILVVLLQ